MWSLVTVNYGNSDKIRELYKSLKKNSPSEGFELIIVDNASPNNDAEKLNTFFNQIDNVKVIALSENLGFGRGNAEGVKFAEGMYLGIINPDIEVKEGCLDRLLSVLKEDTNVGIAVPQLFHKNEEPQANARKFPSFFGLLAHRLFGIGKFTMEYLQVEEREGQDIIPIEWAQGSFLVMWKSLFTVDLQGFDDRFFLFFEDMDLCRRTWELGKRVVKVKSAEAYHGSERLSGGSFFTAIRKKTFWIHLSSALKYFWKYKFKRKPQIF